MKKALVSCLMCASLVGFVGLSKVQAVDAPADGETPVDGDAPADGEGPVDGEAATGMEETNADEAK